LTLKLYNNMGKSAFGMAKDSIMNEAIDVILTNAASSSDLVQVYSLKIMRYNEKYLFEDAINAAKIILNKIGERIDQSMYNNAIIESLIDGAKTLLSSRWEEIIQLNDMADDIYPIALIYRDLFTSSFVANANLFIYISIRMIQLTLSHGLSKYSCLGKQSDFYSTKSNIDKIFLYFIP